MTTTYRATGKLTIPVSDLNAAREYLDEPMVDYIDQALVGVVHTIKWDLADEDTWTVEAVTNRHLTVEESTALSEWISGQNSDGLGEGFEQQVFAGHWSEDDDEDDASDCMSSFDWQTNDYHLVITRDIP